jgi:hypothetical protein
VRGAGCGVRGAGCGVRGAGCGVRGAGCGVRDAGCGVPVPCALVGYMRWAHPSTARFTLTHIQRVAPYHGCLAGHTLRLATGDVCCAPGAQEPCSRVYARVHRAAHVYAIGGGTGARTPWAAD